MRNAIELVECTDDYATSGEVRNTCVHWLYVLFTSRDAQRKARYSDRARPSVCLFVCLSVPF